MSKLDRRLVGDSYALACSLGLVEGPVVFGYFRGNIDEYVKEFMTEKNKGETNDNDRSIRKQL